VVEKGLYSWSKDTEVVAMSGFTDAVISMIGTPASFAGELILYCITALLFLVVLDALLRIIYLIIEKFFP
jgi:hypothetical protein